MIADRYLQLRSEIETALADLLKIGTQMRRPASTLDSMQSLLTDLREPLLFVAVGEVKSGKSSLLNALFGQEFAKVDVLPATDRICIFRYAEKETKVDVSPQVTERHLPIPFLRDFNVVDTPGTNTIVSEHQTITENFIPRADLILFVFSVANPWTQSAWEFLKFVQQKWLKNVVFVLQQADLREPAEVDTIRRHLEDTAMQKLSVRLPIFAVSARKALFAQSTGLDKERLLRESGLTALQEQINLTVSESTARMMKLRSARQTGRVLLDEIVSEIRSSVDVIARDEERLGRVEQFVQARKEQTLRQVTGLVRGIEGACRSCAVQARQMLADEFSFWRTLKTIWRVQRSQRDVQMQVEMKLRQVIEPQVEHSVQLLESDLRGLWPQLQDLLETRLGRELREQLPRTTPDFARQRRELLQSMQLALAEHMASKPVEEQLAKIFAETSSRLRVPATVAAAGTVATIIAAMSSAAIADVTGVLAVSAALGGAVMAIRQRKKILEIFDSRIEKQCSELVQAVEEKLKHAVDVFYNELHGHFQPLVAFCVAQRRIYTPLLESATALQKQFDALASKLGG